MNATHRPSRDRAQLRHARRRRRSSTATGRPRAGRRAARSCCFTAATSIPAASRIWSTSSTCPTSTSSPGTRAATAARRGARGHSPSLRHARCATCRRSSDHIAQAHGIAPRHSPSSRRAWAPCSPPPGRTTTRRASARWCSPRPRSRSSSTCPSRGPASRCCGSCAATSSCKSYVKAKFLTHDPERIASYDADPLITRAISRGHPARRSTRPPSAWSTTRRRSRCRRSSSISGADWVVHHGPQHGFFDRLGSAVKEKHVLAGFYHDTLGERDRAGRGGEGAGVPAAPVRHAGAARRSRAARIAAGATKDEADALARPLPPLSPRALYWAAHERRACASARRSPRASRWGTRPASTRAARSTTSIATRRPARARSAARSTASTSTRSAGAGSACARRTSRNCCARPCGGCAGRARRCGSSTSPPGHGRYVLDACDGTTPCPDVDPAARLRRASTCATAAR